MPIIASKNTENNTVKELCPAGTHSAICFSISDLGLQKEQVLDKTGKKVDKISHKVILAFEIDERMKQEGLLNNKRFVVSRKFTLSLHEKSALRPVLESWRGKAFTKEEEDYFDIEKLVGVPCLINIVYNISDGKTYSNIGSVSPLMKGMVPIVAETDWSEKLPKWIQDLIDSQITGDEHYRDNAKAPASPPQAPPSEKLSDTEQLINDVDKDSLIAAIKTLAKPNKLAINSVVVSALGLSVGLSELTVAQAETVLNYIKTVELSAETFIDGETTPF